MINNFAEIVSQVFNNMCNEKHAVIMREKNVAEIAFKNFSVVLYYCAFEYDLGINYLKNGKEFCIEHVLQNIGIQDEKLPKYKYMSNSEVMTNYIKEYIAIINNYFKELSNIKNL